MLGIGRSEEPRANGPSSDAAIVIAFDCSDPMHEVAHFTAKTDETLLAKVLSHFEEYHPEITQNAVREIVAAATYVDAHDEDEAPLENTGPLRTDGTR